MKHAIRFIILFLVLVIGNCNIWAITDDDVIINIQPDNSAGTATKSVSGMTVTIIANPAIGYSIDADHIIAEKMINAMAARRTPGLASSLPITDNGGNSFSFTIPDGYSGAFVTINFYKTTTDGITSLDQITDMSGTYVLTADVDAAGFTSKGEFTGTLDGGLHKIYNLSEPLFSSTDGAIIRNITFEEVNINETGNVGAVTREAKGTSRIYNIGILSGSVGGTGYTGGLVGFLDGTARVINCYSYATITGGTDVGGIVGYNNGTTTANSIKTMVMNCMFYGDITGGDNVSPVYGGNNINNLQGGLNTYNYYAYEKLKTKAITEGKYNCALAVEEKYLNRFEFYRLLLNSNKKLAALYATGSSSNGKQMAKWVLETADRNISGRSPYPYPILKAQGYYPSIINMDAKNAPDIASVGRNKGGKLGKTLSVTISGTKTDGGQSWPTDASITTSSLTLQRTDKDFDRFNYNYDKVQLPYYNEVGKGNYTGNRVVTGWKITAIDAVTGDPYTAANYDYTKTYASDQAYFDYPNYNFADRKSSNKDLYSVSGRVFSQGAYFDVPYGVTSITIEPYWGKACYIADSKYDVVYKNDYTGKQNTSSTQVSSGATFNGEASQVIKTSVSDALSYINSSLDGYGPTVYDNAVVLVGNLHLDGVPSKDETPFTMMSVDMDNDKEPDFSLIYHHKNRTNICPIRFDFLAVPGTAQVQKPNGASLICNFTIFKTRGWFEVTNTAFMYSSQIEYENGDLGKDGDGVAYTKTDAPLILLGGVFDQFVSTQSSTVNGHTIYIHVGGNVWINSFGMGTHSDGKQSTPHVPVSVTGGDYEGFYLTGTYNANSYIKDDNAECYISGGRFGEVAGASLEQIGKDKNTDKGNVHWQIYDADITEFFGGGINDDKPVQGNITTDIFNSHVDLFCGGPKFGNMTKKNNNDPGKKVTTTAEGCTFGKYFGAGYGGTSIAKKKYYDLNGDQDWATLQGYYTTDRGKYFDGTTTGSSQIEGKDYGKKGPGVATDFDYEFFVWSSGTTGVRFFVKFASFSLAQCNDVSSTLKKCNIETNFYGGGNLGKVVGTATSVLEDCIVKGNVYGAGYSASLPTVEVRDAGFTKNPNFNSQSGMFEPGEFSGTTPFTWENATEAGVTLTNGELGSDLSSHLYTGVGLNTLGQVKNSNLIIKGNTTVSGSVYGGGALASMAADGSTKVNLLGGTIEEDVYGGGEGRLEKGKSTDADYVSPVAATVGSAKVCLNGIETADYDAEKHGSWGLETSTEGYTVPDANKGCIVKGSIFGCNNLNGTPKGPVTVHIFKTQRNGATRITNSDEETQAKVYGSKFTDGSNKGNYDLSTFDVQAVYGGGNLAAYVPDPTTANDEKTRPAATVIIDGCGRTSIGQVYGGGNAASTPATSVTVNGTFEIGEVFGGGNGKDDITINGVTTTNPGANVGFHAYEDNVEGRTDTPANRANYYGYGSGAASVNIYGGKIHSVFGGSNTKGNVRITAVTLLEEKSDTEGAACCKFDVDEAYGGGKSAPMDAEAKLLMQCIPGLKEAYGGAEAADIQGNVALTITNGTFNCVFGGNNLSGTIRGSITVNIEETGCKPIVIGELYGGGNEAGYSVRGYKQVTEGEGVSAVTKWVPRTADDALEPGMTAAFADPQVNVKSFTSIGQVFGGGYGENAVMVGNPTVNINEVVGQQANTAAAEIADGEKVRDEYPVPSHAKGKIGAINNVFGGGNAAKVIGNTIVNVGTLEKITYVSVEDDPDTTDVDESVTEHTVIGADIRGNVYGGGNNAEVTGNTNVNIGRKVE